MISAGAYRGRPSTSQAARTQDFIGRYDLLGSSIHSQREPLTDSVHRFIDQSAPSIVFTGIDFKELGETALRKLFAGMTRSMMKMVVVSTALLANLRSIVKSHAGDDR